MNILRWALTGLIALWALNQLRSLFAVVAVMAGLGQEIGLDSNRIAVLDDLNPIQIGMIAGNAFGYSAAVVFLVLRSNLALPAYALALFLDLASWLSYSTHTAYDQLFDQNMNLLDWVTNIVLMGILFGVMLLFQFGELRGRR
jgi:hypothetical protein